MKRLMEPELEAYLLDEHKGNCKVVLCYIDEPAFCTFGTDSCTNGDCPLGCVEFIPYRDRRNSNDSK